MVGKPAATVIISSPSFILFSPKYSDVSAENANKFAAEPETVDDAKLVPNFFGNFFSNSSAYLPAVSQRSRLESTRLFKSFLSRTLLDAAINVSLGMNFFFYELNQNNLNLTQ